MARPSNTAERRRQIVEGLLSVMERQGYERASVAAIARAAGLSAGLLHYHFDNKQAILVALVETLVGRMQARYEARRQDAGDAPTAAGAERRLGAFVDAHLALGADADPRGVAAWVVVGAEAVRQPEVRQVYQRAIQADLAELRALVADLLRAHGRSTRAATRIAAVGMSAIEGAYQLSAGAPGTLPEGFAAPMVRQMLLAMVRDDRPRSS